MVNNYKCIFNITYFRKHALLKCVMPADTTKYNIPDFKVLGRDLEEIIHGILSIKNLPEEIYLISLKSEGVDEEIFPDINDLCNRLNETEGKEIFKLLT